MIYDFTIRWDRKRWYMQAARMANAPSKQEIIFKIASVVVLGLLFVLLLNDSDGSMTFEGRRPFFVLSFAAYLLYSLLAKPIRRWYSTEKAWRMPMREVALPARLNLHGALVLPGTKVEHFVPWSAVIGLRTGDDMAVLVVKDGSYVALHRSWFDDPQTWVQAVDFAQAQITAAHKPA